MKKVIIFSVLFLAVYSNKSATLVIEGKFQNKNIYVQNFYGGSGVGFCALEVRVNGNISTDECNSSAFEIDLVAMKLKYGDAVVIEILHKDFCKPLVLNAEDLKPRPTFEITTMNLSSTGLLKWTAKNEGGPLPYIIEQYKWNKWVPVGEVNGLGTPDMHDYQFQVPTHSGENKFRVKQVGLGHIPKYSNPVTTTTMIEKPSYVINKEQNELQFSGETAYELYNDYGIVKKGFGKVIKMENLAKGKYYLCYDNQITEFVKKKS